jgi:hypothetical protein
VKTLTENQREVLALLRARGADWTAEATEQAWRKGERYYIDSRNAAKRGIARRFEQGNREAEGRRQCENPTDDAAVSVHAGAVSGPRAVFLSQTKGTAEMSEGGQQMHKLHVRRMYITYLRYVERYAGKRTVDDCILIWGPRGKAIWHELKHYNLVEIDERGHVGLTTRGHCLVSLSDPLEAESLQSKTKK